MRRTIMILLSAMLLTGGIDAAAALRLGLTKGGDKWGYAGEHSACLLPLTARGDFSLTVALTLPVADRQHPLPRESWFGIILEDPAQRTRCIAALFNPDWSATPSALVPALLAYEKNGNLRRQTATEKIPLSGRLWLRVELKTGKLRMSWSRDGRDFSAPLLRELPAGFTPTLAGVTVEAYSAQPVTAVTFDSWRIDAAGKEQEYRFTAAEKWRLNSRRALSRFDDPVASAASSVPAAVKPVSASVATVPGDGMTDVRAAGVAGDGLTEATSVLARLLASGRTGLYFPAGVYPVGKLRLPAGTRLRFAPGAVLRPVGDDAGLELGGNDIVIDGATFDLTGMKGGTSVIRGKGVAGLRFLHLRTATWKGEAKGAEALPKNVPGLIGLESCRDVEVSGGRFADLAAVLSASYSGRVTVRDNKAERCGSITSFRQGSAFLHHYGNWSANVRFQCVWWGGDSNDKKKNVTGNTARIVRRGVTPGRDGFNPDTVGAYDILVQNNFAEHGVTLAWGSKGRNVVICGNLARDMGDMAYDTEGGENVVIADNISINSKCAGIGCYFYGERVLISGNQVLVLDRGDPALRGDFIRLHSPGDSRHFGNGQITISGNQFISELTDRSRRISIEAARDVVIQNNTFRNGVISVSGQADRVTVSGCRFENRLCDAPAVTLRPGGSRHFVKDNIFTFPDGGNRAVPAIRAGARGGARITVSGNVIEGWTTALEFSAVKGSAQAVISGNQSDGRIAVDSGWKRLGQDNLTY